MAWKTVFVVSVSFLCLHPFFDRANNRLSLFLSLTHPRVLEIRASIKYDRTYSSLKAGWMPLPALDWVTLSDLHDHQV